jgi:flagellar capping protein FliD
MTDVPTIEATGLNSFEERLKQVQADVASLQRSQKDLRTEMKRGFDAMEDCFDTMDDRFNTLEARMETMIEEMRRFFARYEHVDAERGP